MAESTSTIAGWRGLKSVVGAHVDFAAGFEAIAR